MNMEMEIETRIEMELRIEIPGSLVEEFKMIETERQEFL